MPTSILLPESTATEMEITIGDKKITMDAFDLELIIENSYKQAEDNGSNVYEEASDILSAKYKTKFTRGQVILLWESALNLIAEVKKNLVKESNFSKRSTRSKSKTKKT